MSDTLPTVGASPGGPAVSTEDVGAAIATTIAAGSNGQTLPQATINVASTAGFPPVGQISVVTGSGTATVQYEGLTATSFTGCFNGTGTMSTGGAVTAILHMPVSKIHLGAHGVDGGAVEKNNPLPARGGATKSTGNSTTANLAANASFTGTGEDVSGYSEITINAFGNPDLAPGTLFFEFSPDNTNWDVSVPVSVTNLNIVIPIPLRVVEQFFRVRYLNGTTAQTTFRLTTYYHYETPGNLVRTAAQVIGTNDSVNVVRALTEPSQKGRFKFTGADRSVSSEGIVFPFVGQVRAEFDAPFANNDITVTTSGGATAVQSSANGAVLTSANAAGASSAKIVSNKKVRYRPGREFRVEFSAGFPTPGITGSTELYGLSDESGSLNRIAIGYVGTTFGLHLYSGGTITSIAQANWNGDPLNGSALSEFRAIQSVNGIFQHAPQALDITKANGWRIRGKWFGVGPVILEVQSPDDGSWIICHTFINSNVLSVPYIQSPNMFPFAEVTKGAGSPVGTINTFSFSWAAGTVEDSRAFEDHEIQSRKLINVGITPQTANFTSFTVDTGRQLYVKSVNINVLNTSLVATGRLDIVDSVAGTTPVLHSFTLGTATNQSSSIITQPMTMIVPMQITAALRFVVVSGTLSYAGSFQGYEKELLT